MKKHSNLLKQSFKTFLPIIISVMSLIFAYIAITISQNSNKIALDAKNINKDNLGIQLDQISQNYVSNAYDEIYYNSDNSFVMQLLRKNIFVKDKQILTRVIDVFEGIGNGACQGTVKFRHIKPYMLHSLSYICDNEQIYNNFKQVRNGVAILCHELYPNSKFTKTLNMGNVNTCEFWDSQSFQNSQNRERFQTK